MAIRDSQVGSRICRQQYAELALRKQLRVVRAKWPHEYVIGEEGSTGLNEDEWKCERHNQRG
jgi:hypothetical protein